MRIFNLFIILMLVICAGGLCTTPLTSAASNDQAVESCHAMDHSAHANKTLNFEQNDNKKIYIDSSCCNEYLTNNTSCQFDAANYPKTLTYSVQIIIADLSNKFEYSSQRGHDPPDLLSLHSRFLI